MRAADKFEYFLETYRRPDGRRWTGQDLYDTTGGFVTRSYVSSLRKGKIGNPGVDKLSAIAKTMGFPASLWFEDLPQSSNNAAQQPHALESHWGIPERLNHLFEQVPDERTGKPYTNEAVARQSLGDLTAEDVDAIRSGRTQSPTVAQVVALAGVFGVDPSYFLDKGQKPPLLDEDKMRFLGDEKTVAIAAKTVNLSDGAKDLINDMIDGLVYLDRDGHKTP